MYIEASVDSFCYYPCRSRPGIYSGFYILLLIGLCAAMEGKPSVLRYDAQLAVLHASTYLSSLKNFGGIIVLLRLCPLVD